MCTKCFPKIFIRIHSGIELAKVSLFSSCSGSVVDASSTELKWRTKNWEKFSNQDRCLREAIINAKKSGLLSVSYSIYREKLRVNMEQIEHLFQ